MLTKKKVLLSILIIIAIGAMFLAYNVNYNRNIQADELYPNNYQFISCFINKRIFYKGSDAIKLDDTEVLKILEKYHIKRARIDSSYISDTTYILFELIVPGRPEIRPKLYVYKNGIIGVDKDNGKDELLYIVQGNQKNVLYDELLEMATANIE